MLKLILLGLISFSALFSTNAQDIGIFDQIIGQLTSQWGDLTADQVQSLFDSFSQTGLNHIWHAIGDHCGSNFECGVEACCVKPTLVGRKRAITDGSTIHFASYCAPLRQLGQSCSKHDNSQHYYTFQCPCINGLTCVPGKLIQIHPMITVQAEATCQNV
jgi:hypothetical protein